MMSDVKISAAQMGPSSETKEENVDRIVDLVAEAVKAKSQIICFPELSLTSYFAPYNDSNFHKHFDTLPNQITEGLFDYLKDKNIFVILPYAEFDGFKYYNSAVIIHKGEIIGKYRKVHLPGAFPNEKGVSGYERLYFAPGNLGFPVFDLGSVKIGIQICYDRLFPEGFRSLALQGAQIIFNPTNAPKWRGDASWERLLRTRAFENGLFVVGVGKGGNEQGKEYLGQSMIISPIDGEIKNIANTDKDELVSSIIDLKDIHEARKILPFWRDRVPHQYDQITQI